MTGDYRGANALTEPDRYPIPCPEDLLQNLHTAEVFSIIELERAYHQIPVAPKDIEKTALTTPFGLFEFLSMPPGLKNSGQTLQRHMHNILRGLDFVRCYIHDLIVVSNSQDEHVKHLGTVFNILRQHNLTINYEMCHFGNDEVTYLEYVVNR